MFSFDIDILSLELPVRLTILPRVCHSRWSLASADVLLSYMAAASAYMQSIKMILGKMNADVYLRLFGLEHLETMMTSINVSWSAQAKLQFEILTRSPHFCCSASVHQDPTPCWREVSNSRCLDLR